MVISKEAILQRMGKLLPEDLEPILLVDLGGFMFWWGQPKNREGQTLADKGKKNGRGGKG